MVDVNLTSFSGVPDRSANYTVATLPNASTTGLGTYVKTIEDSKADIYVSDGTNFLKVNEKFYCNVVLNGNTTLTTITTSNTPVKVAGTTASQSNNGMDVSTTNRITYTGTLTRTFKFHSDISFFADGGANIDWLFYFYKNGVAVANINAERYTTNQNPGSTSMTGFIDLTQNDYVEIWVENQNNATDLTVGYMTFVCESM